jgi:glycosyltransferase involved in cell wall biosynthesis
LVQVAPTPFLGLSAFEGEGVLGGGERYPLELARALATEVDCELVTFGRRPRVIVEREGLRIRVVPTRVWLRRHPVHPLPASLPKWLRGADVVHTHHMRSAPSRIAAVAARLSGQTAVVTDHGLGGGGWGGLLPRVFHGFLTVSEYSARTLSVPRCKTHVIYGGADPRRFFPGSEPRHGALFVGRLTPHKGVDRLLRALPPGEALVVAGSTGHDRTEPERHYAQHLIRLAADRDVRFVGSVADNDLPALYRRARVLVLPSVHDTCYGRHVAISELLSLTVIEAMASGTPVVCSRIGGVPEVVRDGETGYLVEPGNLGQLRERLELLLSDASLARRLGSNARQWVLERFTWRRCAERCLRAYDAVGKS